MTRLASLQKTTTFETLILVYVQSWQTQADYQEWNLTLNSCVTFYESDSHEFIC